MASNNSSDPRESDVSADTENGSSQSPDLSKISRRKLTYVAPALVSRAMFYGAAGCGKGNPRVFACNALRKGSS